MLLLLSLLACDSNENEPDFVAEGCDPGTGDVVGGAAVSGELEPAEGDGTRHITRVTIEASELTIVLLGDMEGGGDERCDCTQEVFAYADVTPGDAASRQAVVQGGTVCWRPTSVCGEVELIDVGIVSSPQYVVSGIGALDCEEG